MGGVSVKHTLDNALLTSENVDCTEADTKQRWTVAARCLKQMKEKLGNSVSMFVMRTPPYWLLYTAVQIQMFHNF